MICYNGGRIVRISYYQGNATLFFTGGEKRTEIRTRLKIRKDTLSLLLLFTSLVIVVISTASSAVITTVWADRLLGTQGDDRLEGTEGDDIILGRGGDDFIAAFGGNDEVKGGQGNDIQVAGFEGDDRVDGGSGDDDVFGGEGNDRVSGGAGNDEVLGDDGDDTVIGGSGDDRMFGGPGADEFVCGAGVDAVIDYNAEEGDTKSNSCEDVGFIRLIKAFAGSESPHDSADFKVEVIGNNPVPPESGFSMVGVLPGEYSVHEIGESGGTLTLGDIVYQVTYSDDCSGTISAGETKVCTITNTFVSRQ